MTMTPLLPNLFQRPTRDSRGRERKDGRWNSYVWKHQRAFLKCKNKNKNTYTSKNNWTLKQSEKTHTPNLHFFKTQFSFVNFRLSPSIISYCHSPCCPIATILHLHHFLLHLFLSFIFALQSFYILIWCLFLTSISNITLFFFSLIPRFLHIPCFFSKKHRSNPQLWKKKIPSLSFWGFCSGNFIE